MNAKAMKARRGMKNWISGAINPAHRGMLHEELHIPMGKKIPAERLQEAAHSKDKKLRARANLALTLRKMRK